MKVKLIRESVNAARRKEIYELGTNSKIVPSIYLLKPSVPTLTIHGTDPIEKYIDSSKIDKNIEIVRIESSINSGVVFTDSDSTLVRVFGEPSVSMFFRNLFVPTAIEELKKIGIEAKLSTHRPGANDLVFVKDGKEKKFSGSIYDMKNNCFGFFFCFSFNSEKIPGLYNLDSQKIKSRGDITDITQIVGGLREISPNINEDVVDKIVFSIVQKLNWVLV